MRGGWGGWTVGATNLYHDNYLWDSVVMEFALRSRLVNGVRLAADLLPGTGGGVLRGSVQQVPIDGEARVRLVLVPPRRHPGRRRREGADGLADRQVDTEDKTVRVHVTQPAAWADGLVALLVGRWRARRGSDSSSRRGDGHDADDAVGMRGGAAGVGAGAAGRAGGQSGAASGRGAAGCSGWRTFCLGLRCADLGDSGRATA